MKRERDLRKTDAERDKNINALESIIIGNYEITVSPYIISCKHLRYRKHTWTRQIIAS
jgi:hypothetical protein